MLRFVPPDPAYHRSWVEAAAEFEAEGEFIHGSGLAPDDLPDAEVKGPIFRASAMRDAETFAAYCTEMTNRQHPEAAYAIGMVPDTKLFIVDGDEFVGMLSLRHELNEFLRQEGGHIGYAVRPSRRREGIATAALGEGLRRAADLGITDVLVTCDDETRAQPEPSRSTTPTSTTSAPANAATGSAPGQLSEGRRTARGRAHGRASG